MRAIAQPLFPLLIVALALGLIWSHRRTWRVAQAKRLDNLEHNYQRRQFRRRMQASGLLALVGVGMLAGLLISRRDQPSLFVWLWCGVVLLLVWIVVLALVDAFSTRTYLVRRQHERLVEKARLEAELHRVQQRQHKGNGHRRPD